MAEPGLTFFEAMQYPESYLFAVVLMSLIFSVSTYDPHGLYFSDSCDFVSSLCPASVDQQSSTLSQRSFLPSLVFTQLLSMGDEKKPHWATPTSIPTTPFLT